MIARKVITAALTSMIFSLALGLLIPNAFGQSITSVSNYIESAALSVAAYVVFTFIITLTYGIICSVLSDKISKLITIKSNTMESILSLLLHIFFGLLFSLYGLAAALLFFSIDRILQSRTTVFTRKNAFTWLVLPVALYILCVGSVASIDFLTGGWKDLLI